MLCAWLPHLPPCAECVTYNASVCEDAALLTPACPTETFLRAAELIGIDPKVGRDVSKGWFLKATLPATVGHALSVSSLLRFG